MELKIARNPDRSLITVAADKADLFEILKGLVGLGKLPDSYFIPMKSWCWVGSRNPLNFLNYRAPSTGTTCPMVRGRCIARATRHRNPRRAGGFPEHTGKRLQT